MNTKLFRMTSDIQKEYHDNMVKFARQVAYERRIVSCVPVREIAADDIDIPAGERWEPG